MVHSACHCILTNIVHSTYRILWNDDDLCSTVIFTVHFVCKMSCQHSPSPNYYSIHKMLTTMLQTAHDNTKQANHTLSVTPGVHAQHMVPLSVRGDTPSVAHASRAAVYTELVAAGSPESTCDLCHSGCTRGNVCLLVDGRGHRGVGLGGRGQNTTWCKAARAEAS